MSIRTYWFFSAEVMGTFGAIVFPSAGERSVVIVLSTQLPLTKSTLKLPALVTAFTYNFRVAWLTLAPAGIDARLNWMYEISLAPLTLSSTFAPKFVVGLALLVNASWLGVIWAYAPTEDNKLKNKMSAGRKCRCRFFMTILLVRFFFWQFFVRRARPGLQFNSSIVCEPERPER